MIIREARQTDRLLIDDIYDRFFSDNEYPDFLGGEFKCPFVVTGSSEEDIILAGGVKTIAEAVVVTDKTKSVRTRMNALLQALGSSVFIAKDMGHKQIYVFVNDDEPYVKHLQKFDFKLINAKLLVLNLGD